MSDHDPLCPSSEIPNSGCLCLWIRDARADERERIAEAIERQEDVTPVYDQVAYNRALTTAARIARNGGSDESR